nr:helix-turn-helix domain-containing protein [Streptomyces sp. NRRL WC-3744]
MAPCTSGSSQRPGDRDDLRPRPLKPGRSTVYDLIRSRRLSSITIGRCRRIPAWAVREYITSELKAAA